MIGGDVLISEIKMKHSHRSPNSLLYYKVDQSSNANFLQRNQNTDTSQPKKSFFQILNMLVNFNIATDPFYIGHIFKCGYLWNIILLVLFSAITQFSFFILIQSWVYGRAYTYNDIWKELFGNKSNSWIVLVIVIMNYITFIIWNQNELYLYAYQTISLLWPDAPSILTNKWFLMYVLSLIFIIPSHFVKKISRFSFLSLISNFSLIVGAVCLVFYFVHHSIRNDISFQKTVDMTGLKLVKNDIFEIFYSIETINLAIFCQPILSVLVPDFENPTRSRLMKLTWISAIFSLIIHFFCAFFSFLINPHNDDNVFYQMEVYNSDRSRIVYPEVILGQIAVYIVSICSNILYVHFTASKLAELILPKGNKSLVSLFFCGLTITLFASAMNFIGDSIYNYTDLIGGICCMLLTYVFPSIFYYSQYKLSQKVFGICSIISIVVGIGFSITLLVLGIIDS